MEKRIGTIIILLRDIAQAHTVNRILSNFSSLIIGRQGVPSRTQDIGIISIILEATTDEFGALSGQLGRIRDIHVKSALFPASDINF
ncbi:MAG: CopG family transcriptional regulator [Bacteroidetes bacterium]|nr:MAG: CopG family transcriptional regulator [Bacteroidota bacterium]PIE88662.1 MAG: CopG family transcriptional regulator [Bacteroidota bacterium]